MKKLIKDRWEVLSPLLKGKRVLDIGCVNHEASSAISPEWLHGKVCGVARETVGIDCAKDEVETLRRQGFNVKVGDAESFDLNDKFEVIVAGNIIEHLSNPGQFLNACKRHLVSEGGILALTTDNCYGLRSLKAVFLKDKILPNQEHVIAFEEAVLRQLCQRHGYQIQNFYYYNGPYPSAWKKMFIDGLCCLRKSWAWQMLVLLTPSK